MKWEKQIKNRISMYPDKLFNVLSQGWTQAPYEQGAICNMKKER